MTEPDEAMAAQAAADWRAAAASKLYRRQDILVVQTRRTASASPSGKTSAARAQDLGIGPARGARIDLAVTDQQGRVMLAKELIALADLWAAHKDEFRGHLASEEVLTALAKTNR